MPDSDDSKAAPEAAGVNADPVPDPMNEVARQVAQVFKERLQLTTPRFRERIVLVPGAILSLITFAILFLTNAGADVFTVSNTDVRSLLFDAGVAIVFGFFTVFMVVSYWAIIRWVLNLAKLRREAIESRISRAEEALSPSSQVGAISAEKVQPAWDLARGTLEQYWQRNLTQNLVIFALSVVAITAGFIVMAVGVHAALTPGMRIEASAVATCSGLLTQFIGASFLFIYRSTMQQAAQFNVTLERINSVGMAWYIVDSMAELSPREKTLKSRMKGLIALQIMSAGPEAVNASVKETGSDLSTASTGASDDHGAKDGKTD